MKVFVLRDKIKTFRNLLHKMHNLDLPFPCKTKKQQSRTSDFSDFCVSFRGRMSTFHS